MEYQTLLVKPEQDYLLVTLNRLDKHNSINNILLKELNLVLTAAENNPQIHSIILQGQAGIFCTGMDFAQAAENSLEISNCAAEDYMNILKRFTSTEKIMIAKVAGKVLAGGVGLVAACDLVIANDQAHFGLSEVLWGLLPANVMPFLIRRIGFQKAYALTLTAQTISAKQAYELHLVDEYAENIDDATRKLLIRLRRVKSATVLELKNFLRKMWIIDAEMEKHAVQELQKLMTDTLVIDNIKNYILHKKLPWEEIN